MKEPKIKHYGLDDSLAAYQLASDPRVSEAKALLAAAIIDAQKTIKGIRPPTATLKVTYDKMIADFSSYRGASLWFPYIGSGFGNGVFVELADGSIKYDFICGIGPHYLGHTNPKIVDAAVDAAISNTVMQGNLQQNVDSLELSEMLVKLSGLDHCFLSSSGAMANENALKIAFQKNYPAYRVLAFDKCFVGRSLAVSQITDKAAYREGLPPILHVDYVPYFDPKHPEESTKKAVDALKKYIHRYPKQHAIMCFELIQGEGGFFGGTKEFFTEIMTVAKDNGIAIFADEVQSFGRTSELFAYQHFELQKFVDIASIGKLSQVCATLFTEEYKPKPGLLSQTFTSSTSAIKTSKVILNELVHGGYYGRNGKITAIHDYFADRLAKISSRHPDKIQGPFGVGCMIAFTAYGGDTKLSTDFVHRLFKAGVISFIAGSDPMRIRFLIPVGAITHKDIDNATDIIENTLIEKPSA
jgi:4-aminobutyrate aminotransferase-like enzyme